MKRFALLLGVAAILQAFTEMQTPQSVNDFYGGMEKLASVKDANAAKSICISMKESFLATRISSSGGNIPNDFRFFDYDEKNSMTHSDKQLSTSLYVDRLEEFLFKDKVMRIKCDVKGSEDVGDQPEFSRGKLSSSVSIIASYVTKTYSIKGFEKVFNDTVLTDTSSGKINEIRNGFGRVQIANINALRIKAALAYRQKNYVEAYKAYEEIISIATKKEDAQYREDALYRIGLMTYYRQGCDFPKKVARSKGKSYMEKARYVAEYRSPIKQKAENVLYHWEYPND